MAQKKTAKTRTASNSSAPQVEGDVFDVERVRKLAELMKEHELAEVELRQDERCLRLRRGADPVASTIVAAPTPVASPPPTAPPSEKAQTPTAAPQTDDDNPNIHIIRSPMVGTFYSRPKPDAEPYVKVGDHISGDTTVCLIEAMKNYMPIPADCSGKIIAVLVDNEQSVDVNMSLFKVDTSQ